MHGELYLPRRLKIILEAILCLFVPGIYINARLHHKLAEFRVLMHLHSHTLSHTSGVQVMCCPYWSRHLHV